MVPQWMHQAQEENKADSSAPPSSMRSSPVSGSLSHPPKTGLLPPVCGWNTHPKPTGQKPRALNPCRKLGWLPRSLMETSCKTLWTQTQAQDLSDNKHNRELERFQRCPRVRQSPPPHIYWTSKDYLMTAEGYDELYF